MGVRADGARGRQFQAGLAASRRPVLHVRASQDGPCAPTLMPVSVALSPGMVNSSSCRARLPGGQLAIAGMGAVDVADPADLVGHAAGQAGAGGLARTRTPRATRYLAGACSVPHCGSVSVNGSGASRPR